MSIRRFRSMRSRRRLSARFLADSSGASSPDERINASFRALAFQGGDWNGCTGDGPVFPNASVLQILNALLELCRNATVLWVSTALRNTHRCGSG
jgi:hypothetical protein